VIFIASEPLTFERGDWMCVPSNTIITISKNNTVLVYPILDEFYTELERSSDLAMSKGLMGGVPHLKNEDAADETVVNVPPLAREGREPSSVSNGEVLA
jgi:glutamine amidotransferase